MINPYLDLFEFLAQKSSPQFLSSIRRKVIWSYAWAIPNDQAITALNELGPLIEIGAGSGYWSWMIQQVRGDILAFDHNSKAPPHWCEVLPGDEMQIEEFPSRTLFLCWPPNESSMASRCLELYSGKIVAFVGEKSSGVTADHPFHQRMDQEFQVCQKIEIPQWPDCRDALYIYRRKNS